MMESEENNKDQGVQSDSKQINTPQNYKITLSIACEKYFSVIAVI